MFLAGGAARFPKTARQEFGTRAASPITAAAAAAALQDRSHSDFSQEKKLLVVSHGTTRNDVAVDLSSVADRSGFLPKRRAPRVNGNGFVGPGHASCVDMRE